MKWGKGKFRIEFDEDVDEEKHIYCKSIEGEFYCDINLDALLKGDGIIRENDNNKPIIIKTLIVNSIDFHDNCEIL